MSPLWKPYGEASSEARNKRWAVFLWLLPLPDVPRDTKLTAPGHIQEVVLDRVSPRSANAGRMWRRTPYKELATFDVGLHDAV